MLTTNVTSIQFIALLYPLVFLVWQLSIYDEDIPERPPQLVNANTTHDTMVSRLYAEVEPYVARVNSTLDSTFGVWI